MDNIKVVWICSFSNEKIRKCFAIKQSGIEKFIYKLFKPSTTSGDSAIWNVNAIEEFENFSDVELHIICPVRGLRKRFMEDQIDNINYHLFRDENSSVMKKIIRFLFTKNLSKFHINRKRIKALIDKISPDLVHVMGAENPQYSLGLLDVPSSIPTILQLQSLLLSVLDIPMEKSRLKDFKYKAKFEFLLIHKANFVGTTALSFRDFIVKNIKPDVIFVNTTLAMAQKINIEPCKKKFDFVHYASTLNDIKATDVAIEAFAIAHNQCPNITLDVIGAIDVTFKKQLVDRMEDLGIKDSVTFEGRLKTHDDVINQIRKSRFALLPLKTDILPNTLYEAMANGLPLITTVTTGTPRLNEEKQCALISEQGDVVDIANNMISLINNSELVETLRQNAAEYEYKRDNNFDICRKWVMVYNACIENKKNGTPISNQ